MVHQVTLKQVAARAGVSYQTVSKVLNGQAQVSKETEQRIMGAVRELGYRPNQIARNMRAKRSRMIGYSWVQTSPNQVNYILDQFLTSMVLEAEAAGYHLLPFPFREGDAHVNDYRELIDTGRVDGFVLSSVNYDDPRISFLLERKFPFVAFGRSNPELDFPYVDVDGVNGLCQTMQYLISQGHRRIAAIAWPENSRVGNERLRGYFESMQIASLEIRPEWIARGEGDFAFGFEATAAWMKWPTEQRPTAIVALNDVMAIGAMQAVQQSGLRVGKDIAITGFDDMPLIQYLIPSLTSVRQPVWEVGQRVINMLLSMMEDGEPSEKHVLVEPRLILRDSTRCSL